MYQYKSYRTFCVVVATIGIVTSTPAERLRQARAEAGYGSAAAFARATDAAEATYRAHENGKRQLTIAAAKRYARALERSWEWLMFGDEFGLAPREPDGAPLSVADPKSNSVVIIDELDGRPSAPEGMRPREEDGERQEKVVGKWSMPANVVRYHTSAPAGELKIIRVVGDSMEPDFLAGERVMVDTGDRLPSPPGVFAVWDGFSEIVKRLEMVPYSDPPRVKLMSVNPAYEPRELRLDEMVINGRVVGKWKWT
ncbi:MAG: S24 family peptidase [Alphaproteobacteria bacterium]|nr:S24 family peptidase [Alphaproteobacteria bacterium]